MSAYTRRLGTYRKYIRTLVKEGKLDRASALAAKHKVDVPELNAALAARNNPPPPTPTGGEGGRADSPPLNPDRFNLPSNFSQLELERVKREVDKRLEKIGEDEGIVRGSAREVVKNIEEVKERGAKGKADVKEKKEDGEGLVISLTERCGGVKPSSKTAELTVLDKEIAERKRRAEANPWPEESEARVCGFGGKWQMQIELVPDGRKTWVWKGGYNLYLRERLRVKIAERLGEDAIYGVKERLEDAAIEPKISTVGMVEKWAGEAETKAREVTMPDRPASVTVPDVVPENASVTVGNP